MYPLIMFVGIPNEAVESTKGSLGDTHHLISFFHKNQCSTNNCTLLLCLAQAKYLMLYIIVCLFIYYFMGFWGLLWGGSFFVWGGGGELVFLGWVGRGAGKGS